MLRTARLLRLSRTLRLLHLDLVQPDVPVSERDWFAQCRIRQFRECPILTADALRSVIGVWLLMPTGDGLIALATIALIALLSGQAILHRSLRPPVARPQQRLLHVQATMVVRGLIWSLILHSLVRSAGADLGPVLLFGLGALLLDLLFMLAFPLTAVISGALLVAGIASGLAAIPSVTDSLVLVLALMTLAGLHYASFHLYHLFATRRLRSKRLRDANETIHSLLTQYDEHGADALIEVDEDGRVRRPSPRLCEILARTRIELEGCSIADLFEPGRERSALLGCARRQHQFRDQVVPLTIRGERHWWSVSGCAMHDVQGRRCGFRYFAQDVTAQRENEERIRVMATRDNLTGLVNRTIFTERLAEALASRKPGMECGVLFIDLDSFKLVNDTYGHAAGDAVLIEAARRIEGLLGPEMIAARLGGDEFAVLVCGVTHQLELAALGGTIVSTLSMPIVRDDMVLPCGASVGVAIGPEHGEDGSTLLRAADIALYEAKARGRRMSVLFHPDLLRGLQEQRELEMDLRMAMARGQFEMWYQPIVDLASRHTVGYEALLRWHHPERGIVSPGQFVPMAEEAGIMGPIGAWALRTALTQAATWQSNLIIAVNVSAAQLRCDDFIIEVEEALTATGIAPQRLELEITESLLLDECEGQLDRLRRLQTLGVRIALDDFGTGYSSLSYLRRFAFDKLKVDRSFVSDIVHDAESRAIVETVLRLARQFRMETTAEGIECDAQLAALVAMGCDQAQGYLFDRPKPAEALPKTAAAADYSAAA